MNRLDGNKKILISIVGFMVVISAVIGVLLMLSGTGDDNYPPVNSSDIYKPQESTGISEEDTSSATQTTSPAMNLQISATEGEIIEAYISGSYYISGTMYSDGVSTDMDLAIDGQDFHTTVDMDGVNMGIMFRSNKVYVINSNEKKYIDFDSIAALIGGQMDFDLSELKEVTSVLDLSEYQFKGVDQSKVDFEGETANCYRYYTDEISIWFYFVAGNLRQIDLGNANGDVATSISVKAFSPYVPSNMLTLSGLRQATIFDFFGADLMQQLQ